VRRFGIEIEFSELNGEQVSSFELHSIENYVVVDYGLYSIGFDGPYFEARSSILTDMSQAHEMVKQLKDGARICKGHHCGIHVHVEHQFNKSNSFILKQAIKLFWGRNYDRIVTEFKPVSARLGYCWNLDPTIKHSMIHINSEYPTIEFRLFNATLNSRYVCRCVEKAQQWTDEIIALSRNIPSGVG
jgi:hypothetical protein